VLVNASVNASIDADTGSVDSAHRADSRPPPRARNDSGGGHQRENWLPALAILIVGMFMAVLDVSIVNVAIPAMQKGFGATQDDIEWIVTAYTLTLGVVVPISGWLGDRVGLSRAYLGSLLCFAAGSALCGVAGDLGSMVAFRVLQGIPGGLLPVITLTMLRRIVPPAKLGAAMGVYGLGVVVAPAVGPLLGGYLVEYHDWRLIFFINVPIGLLGWVAAVLVLPGFPPGQAGGSTCSASSPSPAACSRCSWRCPRGRTGAGTPTGS
jgi:MFS family permease